MIGTIILISIAVIAWCILGGYVLFKVLVKNQNIYSRDLFLIIVTSPVGLLMAIIYFVEELDSTDKIIFKKKDK